MFRAFKELGHHQGNRDCPCGSWALRVRGEEFFLPVPHADFLHGFGLRSEFGLQR